MIGLPRGEEIMTIC